MAITPRELIENAAVIKYSVEFECVEDSPGWGKLGDRTRIVFDAYDVDKFSSYAPKNWEIRRIDQTMYPDA